MEYGYVYCTKNKYMQGLSKIGSTEKNPLIRIDQLGRYTGCPTPFTLHYFIKVKNPKKYKKIIHNQLNNFRVNAERQFFTIRPELALEYFNIEKLIENNNQIIINDFAENYLTILNI